MLRTRDVEAVPLADTLELHRLAGYCYEVATAFYETCRVLTVPPAVRASRLALCTQAGATLRLGLDLLGIPAPERM